MPVLPIDIDTDFPEARKIVETGALEKICGA